MSTPDQGAWTPEPDRPDNATPDLAGAGSPRAGSPGAGNPSAESGGASGVQGQAQQAADTAKEEGMHVADVAKSEAQNVAAEAKTQASHLLDDARVQLEEQSSTQLDRLVGVLREFGDDLERMVRGEPSQGGPAQELVGEVADRARALRSRLEGHEPAELLDQLRDFARRRPGTFLLGSLAAGVVAGRLTRGVKEAHHDGQHTSKTSSTSSPAAGDTAGTSGASGTVGTASPAGMASPSGTAGAAPLAGTGAPTTDPVYPESAGPLGSTP